jgi:hypothetical protein
MYEDISGYGEEIVDVDDVGYDEMIGDDDYDDGELGYDEMIGDEVDELLQALSGYVGARRRPRSQRRARPKRRSVLRKVRPSVSRRYPLGLGITAVGIGATAIIAVNPQLPFKLLRLSTAVAGFTIDNIQIGTTSQFVAAGAIPSEVFAPNAIGVALRGDTAVPGVQIQITVTNTGLAIANFTGALFGTVAQ